MNEQKYREVENDLFKHAAIAPTEHWIDLPADLGGSVRVMEVGEGTPALFLHGGPAAGAIWAELVGHLDGVRAFLLDRPGCGLSLPPATVPDADTLPTYVARLTAAVLDGLGLDRASLVGSSLGGYSALRSAAEYPDRIDRVVLAGCPPFAPGWKPPSFFAVLRTPLLGRLFLRLPATPGGARMYVKQMGHERSLASDSISAPMLAWTQAWQGHTDTMKNDAAMIVASGTWLGGFRPDLDLTPEELARVSSPCSIIAGADDPVGGVEVVRHLASLLPDAVVEVVPESGHLPWLDHPADVAARVSSFLS